MCGEKPKQLYPSLLKKGDHPELDTSDLLDADGIQKFQSMIGVMQWAISIGHFDTATAVMSLSSFRIAPHVGHLECCKHIYAYLNKMQHSMIRVRTVETAMFGSKANATRTATEQIIDLHGTLRYMGVPLRDTSYMFGDNKTVVDSGSLPHAKLHKRHSMLSYHCIREAITSGMVKFFHIPGEINPADILGKHWGHQQIWKQLQPLLFWKGDT